ncbi:MAG: DUF559 domain-containing protein [Acidimicrobiia bacterium]|nr:DUF559 domain-containing protein [Acidimicrobiia bacterium]
MNEAEARFLATASRQHGVGSRDQARRCGMTDRMLDARIATDRLEVVLPAVYRVAGSVRTGRQLAMAAALWAGARAAVSHLTAARLLRLEGVAADSVHVTVEGRRRIVDDRLTVHRTLALPRMDRCHADGIPVTAAARTIIDSAALLDGEALEVAFESARRMGLVTVAHIARRLDDLGARGRPGAARLRALIDAHAGQSPLEYRLEVKTARLLRASRLPNPAPQHRVEVPDGRRYRLDFAWPRQFVAVECDGFEAHGSRLAWKRDRHRLAALEALGWRIVHLTWDDVTRRPEESLHRVALAIDPVGQAA